MLSSCKQYMAESQLLACTTLISKGLCCVNGCQGLMANNKPLSGSVYAKASHSCTLTRLQIQFSNNNLARSMGYAPCSEQNAEVM